LRGRTISEKIPKIPLFEPSLIHHLQLLGSQQHLQSGVLVTTFSTWGTENSLAETNLESKGVSVTFFGVKNWQTLAALWAHYRATRKTLESRTQLDKPVACSSGGDPLLLYKILDLLFFPLV
jgi:hypothetical protein